MTTSREQDLLDVAAAIADGAPVAWDRLGATLEPELIARLKQVQALAGSLEPVPAASAEIADAGETFSSAPVAVEPAQWGHLRLDAEIGRGASGIVYRAWDAALQRHVALKLCTCSGLDPAALLREAQLMARVDHPNVLKVHGAAERDGVVGLWSDLLAGQSLAEWAREHPRLNAGELVALGLELCTALAALHAVGVVHGDLKTANVVRHPAGRWVLVDFGSGARLADLAPRSSGTPLYLAPEAFEGAPLSPRGDLYSLGALLFRMATGRHPVEAESFEALRAKHRDGERVPLLDVRPDLPEALIAVVTKALAADPRDRWPSAGSMAEALRGVLASPVAPAATAPPRPRRMRWIVAATAALAATIGAYAFFSGRAPPAPELTLVKTTSAGRAALRDGDSVAPGDALALEYRNAAAAHVYVINEDADGAVFQLFPLPGAALANPLPAGKSLRLPGVVDGREVDWQITSRGRRERFHVLVSAMPLPALEQRGLAAAELGRPIDRAALLADTGAGPLRGAGGLVARPEPAGPAIPEWIAALRAQHPGLSVRSFELANP